MKLSKGASKEPFRAKTHTVWSLKDAGTGTSVIPEKSKWGESGASQRAPTSVVQNGVPTEPL